MVCCLIGLKIFQAQSELLLVKILKLTISPVTELEKIVEKIAFKMKLYPGMKDEYKKRHDEIWSELSELLVKAGVRDYSIFLDQDTNFLFAVMWREEDHKMDQLRSNRVLDQSLDRVVKVLNQIYTLVNSVILLVSLQMMLLALLNDLQMDHHYTV